MPVKILLVEDHKIVRQGLVELLKNEDDVQVVAEAGNGAEALAKLDKISCDLLLMDMNMPEMNGLECTRVIKRTKPGTKILILSMYDHESYLADLMEAGADGYILKSCSKDDLLFAIRKIAAGGIYIGPEFAMNLLTKKKPEVIPGDHVQQSLKLSDREMAVLELIAQGMTNMEMAKKLFISVRTIETRRKKILEKTGTTNTATLMRFALKNGLIR